MVLEDGVSHIVDSSELAFKLAARGAMRNFFPQANPVVLEPVMSVEVVVPQEFQVSEIMMRNLTGHLVVQYSVY